MENQEALAIMRALASGMNPETGVTLEVESICRRPQVVKAMNSARERCCNWNSASGSDRHTPATIGHGTRMLRCAPKFAAGLTSRRSPSPTIGLCLPSWHAWLSWEKSGRGRRALPSQTLATRSTWKLTFFPDERHKGAPAQRRNYCHSIALTHQLKILTSGETYGNHHAPPLPQLLKQWLRNMGSCCRYHDGVKRLPLRQSCTTIANQNHCILVAQPRQSCRSFERQPFVPFDGVHVLRQFAQKSRLVSTARSNFEYGVRGLQAQGIQSDANDIRLGNSLIFANRQRMIFVCLAAVFLGYELMPRNSIHRFKHALVAQAARTQLGVHHSLALSGEAVDFGIKSHGMESA
jgi:hypothetical protein